MCQPEPFPFPEVLPRRPPKRVLDWHDGTILKMAETIFTTKCYEDLSVLADALEEAGCTDPILLTHLRGNLHNWFHRPGCWHNSCWVLNLLLQHDQVIECRFRWGTTSIVSTARVLNPGGWQGRIWMIHADGVIEPYVYIVEAEHASDAEDEFVDSEYGESVRILADSPEADDYGELFRAGESLGNRVFEQDTWLTVSGKEVPGPLADLIQCQYSGSGHYYDSSQLYITDSNALLDARYFGPGLPYCGVKPEHFEPYSCNNCQRSYFVTDGYKDENFCSVRCEWQWQTSEPTNYNLPWIVCPECELPVDPVQGDGYKPGDTTTVGLHFPSYASGDYATPAEDPEDVIVEESTGAVLQRVCPGSGRMGGIEWPQGTEV